MFTQENLEKFGTAIVENFNEWSNAHNGGYNVGTVTVEFEEGKKYIRVIKNDGVSQFVHSFVLKEDGSIWKAAGWKAPAKNKPRGNIDNLAPNVVYWTGAF